MSEAMKEERRELAIGVDIGGTRTKFGLVGLDSGEVLDVLITSTETKAQNNFSGKTFSLGTLAGLLNRLGHYHYNQRRRVEQSRFRKKENRSGWCCCHDG